MAKFRLNRNTEIILDVVFRNIRGGSVFSEQSINKKPICSSIFRGANESDFAPMYIGTRIIRKNVNPVAAAIDL